MKGIVCMLPNTPFILKNRIGSDQISTGLNKVRFWSYYSLLFVVFSYLLRNICHF
jgi:hypothetical protein